MVEELPDALTRELTIELSPLSGGSVNRSYRVRTPAGCFVLRLSPGPDAWLAADRSVELELHRVASEAGIAPRIVQANDRWLITGYVAGRLWVERDFGDPERLATLGDTLRRLHALPAPECGRFDLLGALAGYVGRVEAAAARVAAGGDAAAEAGGDVHAGDAADCLRHYLKCAAVAWDVCGAALRPVAIVHHDLHGSNLIDGADGLVLIDWECAAVTDPLLDVACILSYHEAAWPYASLLLRNSGLEMVTSRQLAASVWLFDLHTYLWYRERRTRLAATDAERAAEHHLSVRLPQTLGDWLPEARD